MSGEVRGVEVRRSRYGIAASAAAASLGLHAAVLSLALRQVDPVVGAPPRPPVILSLAGTSLGRVAAAEPRAAEAVASAGDVATASPAPESPPASAVALPPAVADVAQPAAPLEPVPPALAADPVPIPPPSQPAEPRETPATAEPEFPPGVAAAAPPASREPLPDPTLPDDLPAAGAPGLAPAGVAPPPVRMAEGAPDEIGPARDVIPAPETAADVPPEAMGQPVGAFPTQGSEVSPLAAPADEPPAAGASVASPAGIAPPPARTAEVASAEVGPARETPVIAAPAAIVSPETPLPPVEVVGVPAAVVAFLEAPAVSAERVRGFVDRYDGGPCFLASATRTTPTGADIETFSATVDQVMAFHAAFTGQLGVEPDVVGQRVWSAQCPAVELLRRTRPSGSDPLALSIDRRQIHRGESLSGTISGIRGRRIALFLITEGRAIEDLTGALKGGTETSAFETPVRRTFVEESLPQMLIAIASLSSISAQAIAAEMSRSVSSLSPSSASAPLRQTSSVGKLLLLQP